jgi:diguanylate cyclase (GGDEF)-like protein
MKLSFKDTSSVTADALAEPVFESSVRALYDDPKALFVGKIAVFLSLGAIWYRTGDTVVMVMIAVLLASGLIRLVSFRNFHRALNAGLKSEDYKTWERRYSIWGSVFLGLIGLFDFLIFARQSDGLVHLFAISMTMAYVIGISGRNFASASIVQTQVLVVSVPMVLGLILFGDSYHTLLGMMLIPFFVALNSIAARLRTMLTNAVLTALENKTIAERFDIALRNVSHGLALMDREGNFVVANARFAPLAGLQAGTPIVNQNIAILPDLSTSPEAPGARPKALREVFTQCLSEERPARFKHVLSDGCIVESIYNPTNNGGGVFVLEDVTERISSEQEIRKLASFDPLTHLPNRRFFAMEINRVLQEGEGLGPCSIFFVDLDNFKDVNDSLGHTIGDKLLCSVALRMRSRMPEKGMVCRFGGDEFVIVVPGRMQRRECSAFAELLIEEISKPMVIDGNNLSVGASIGIAQCPANGKDYNHLLKVSDVALYDAKARGRGCHSFYSDELGDVIRDRRVLENELRRAIERGQLQINYQPLVSIRDNRVKTCEALLRWHHPERGPISPAVFIPIAEEIGIISQIGKFVLEEATKVCATWPGNVSVAVNVSSLQFQQSDVCAVVSHAIARSGLDPRRLEVEVTESAMLGNVGETTAVLSRLAKLGVRISLDDFGTGFSSLSYLHALPLDKVKIDRSFIESIHEDERSLVLLSGVTHLARELGLSVTIEGVETSEQMQILTEKVHVDEMQGYLFGRAMPADDIVTLLTAQNPATQIAKRHINVGS